MFGIQKNQSGKNLNCPFSLLLLLRVCDSFVHTGSRSENACDSLSQGLLERCSALVLFVPRRTLMTEK